MENSIEGMAKKAITVQLQPETIEGLKKASEAESMAQGVILERALDSYLGLGGEMGPDTRLDEILELLHSLPQTFQEAMDEYKARNGKKVDPNDEVRAYLADTTEGFEPKRFDPRSVPGVAVGIPAGGFSCRCVHSGCKGSKFQGTTRFQNLCPACLEMGHQGEPRSCEICFEDTGPA